MEKSQEFKLGILPFAGEEVSPSAADFGLCNLAELLDAQKSYTTK